MSEIDTQKTQIESHRKAVNKYNKDKTQVSFRLSNNDKALEDAVMEYCKANDISLSSLGKLALYEKMEREGFLQSENKQ